MALQKSDGLLAYGDHDAKSGRQSVDRPGHPHARMGVCECIPQELRISWPLTMQLDDDVWIDADRGLDSHAAQCLGPEKYLPDNWVVPQKKAFGNQPPALGLGAGSQAFLEVFEGALSQGLMVVRS